MSEKYKEFWISPSKTWSEETKSYSIETTSVIRITEESAMRIVIENTVGIRVIEYAALEAERARSRKLAEALDAIVWSWENDAGRECFGTAQDALVEYNKGEES